MPGSPSSYDPAETSHQALRGIKQELSRNPIVTTVQGFPSGQFTQVVAELDVTRWGVDREDATLTVRWFAGDTPDSKPEFSFHYGDTHTDFGWHHHEQNHVDGWGHFQKRTDSGEYEYTTQRYPSYTPRRLVWEVLDWLSTELQE